MRLAMRAGENQNPAQMNSKAPVVVLILLCLGLLAGLIVRHNQATSQKEAADLRYRQLAEEKAKLQSQFDELNAVNKSLKVDEEKVKNQLDQTAKQLTDTKSALNQKETAVQEAAKALKDKEAELAKREAKIAELENQNSTLDKQAADMKSALAVLEGRISDTQKKLNTAVGDRDYLLSELQRLETEKSNLQRRLNDVVALKEQIKKLKEDLSISKGLEALRRELYGAETKKGAELLQQGFRSGTKPATAPHDLNVEIRRDGSATILTPTNAPAPAPAPVPTTQQRPL